MKDLSVLIPARNEKYLKRTVDDVLRNIRGDTEILIGLDGEWADPPIDDDPRVTVLYRNEVRGQRGITNDLANISKGRYLMKLDAHCKVAEGFDVELMKGFEELGDNVVQIPAMYNLHAFNWKCMKCGNEWYQSPTPNRCWMPGESREKNLNCDSKAFQKVMIWDRRKTRRSEAYCFDSDPHFQYHREQMRRTQGDFVESMSIQGSCFVLSREKYFKWNACDEKIGSWGSQGIEVACKAWLSGGKVVTNRKTWYSHLFRTQGGDFGFPFPNPGSGVQNAKKRVRELFFTNSWDQQVRPIQWLIEKFDYPRDWTPEKVEQLCSPWKKKDGENLKGIIYYTDNQLDMRLARKVREQILRANLPITSASLKPLTKFGNNIYVPRERGRLTMFIQILTALENSTADIVFFCEHDVFYHPSHFDFTPKEKDVFYFNNNLWKVDKKTGKALKVDKCEQLSGMCVYRSTALEWAREKVTELRKDESNRHYEPRGKRGGWLSKEPNVDVRHDNNMTKSRWSKDQFRNQIHTKGWTEGECPAWAKDLL
jgi:glycosyltransferase involved in cell wall biosynthesis